MPSLTTVVNLGGEIEYSVKPSEDGGGHVNVWIGDSMFALYCSSENARKLARAFQELAAEGGQK